MIWIGTSGWVYPHWMGRFYPRGLPPRDHLAFYARHFPTVEINRSFYRLPSRENFVTWAEEIASHPHFCFAVKASRYVTHMKKLREVDEGVERLVNAATGLGTRLGPFLYQLPPHWRANLPRLESFIKLLPRAHQTAFEFRDASWYQPAVLEMLEAAGCALVVPVFGAQPDPAAAMMAGPFHYIRFHHGAYGTGLTDGELRAWADRIAVEAVSGREVYIYFNNDPDGHAITDARRLRDLLPQERVVPHTA